VSLPNNFVNIFPKGNKIPTMGNIQSFALSGKGNAVNRPVNVGPKINRALPIFPHFEGVLPFPKFEVENVILISSFIFSILELNLLSEFVNLPLLQVGIAFLLIPLISLYDFLHPFLLLPASLLWL